MVDDRKFCLSESVKQLLWECFEKYSDTKCMGINICHLISAPPQFCKDALEIMYVKFVEHFDYIVQVPNVAAAASSSCMRPLHKLNQAY